MWLYTVAKAIAKLPFPLFFRVTVSGKEHIPTDNSKGFILAANHISALDPVVLAITLKQQVRFMAKEELFKNRFLGFLLKNIRWEYEEKSDKNFIAKYIKFPKEQLYEVAREFIKAAATADKQKGDYFKLGRFENKY